MTRRIMVSLLGILAALATGLFGHPAEATPQVVPAASTQSYDYDSHGHSEVPYDAVTERGSRDAYDHTIRPAVDSQLFGASPRPAGSESLVQTTYDDASGLVQVAQTTGTTSEPAQWLYGDLRGPHGGQVAANTAAKACSFAGATTVLMADGTKKPIDQIKVGDKVLATDPETGEQKPKKVEHVFVHYDDLSDLQLADGSVLTTTEDHPYWSVGDQRFERADELSKGERVLGADGHAVEISGLRLATTHEGLAYNLEIEGIHTYHVGDDAILVHNTCLSALRGWSSSRFQFGNAQFQLDKSGMSHILQRHHPSYWDGSAKASQTFFDKSMSIADVENAVGVVARGNRAELIRIGAGQGQVQGSVNGVVYVLGVSGGRIGQFYPGTLP